MYRINSAVPDSYINDPKCIKQKKWLGAYPVAKILKYAYPENADTDFDDAVEDHKKVVPVPLDDLNQHITQFSDTNFSEKSLKKSKSWSNLEDFTSKSEKLERKREKHTRKLNQHLPEPRSGHHCSQHGNSLFVFGGYSQNFKENGVFSNREARSSGENGVRILTISEFGQPPITAGFHYGHNIAPQVIYNHVFKEIWRLNLETNVWTRLKIRDGNTSKSFISDFFAASGSLVPMKTYGDDTNICNFLYSGGCDYPWTKVGRALLILKIDVRDDTFQFEKIGETISPTYLHSSCLTESGRLYLFGGYQLDQTETLIRNLDDFTAFDIFGRKEKIVKNTKLVEKFDSSTNTKKSAIASLKSTFIEHNKKLYLLPSQYNIDNLHQQFFFKSLYCFDPETETWSQQPLNPDPNENFKKYATIKLYHSVDDFLIHNDHLEYEASIEPFNFPVSRWRFGSSVYESTSATKKKKKILIISGGQAPMNNYRSTLAHNRDFFTSYITNKTFEIFRDIWALDFDTFTWKLLGFLPESVFFHSQVVTNNQELVIFGGKVKKDMKISINENFLERTNMSWTLGLNLEVRQLKDICAEVLKKDD